MGVLVIAGTTASGKSSLAMRLAMEHNAVIVSADAMTVYRGLDIGTAKPSVAERQQVQHFGIDVRDINEEFDVDGFIATVDTTIESHEHVIIVGGTTFWLSALLRPMASLPRSSPELRAELASQDNPHAALVEIDPETAARLHPNDQVRVIRALEVFALTGMTQTELHATGPSRAPLEASTIFLSRDDWVERINQRTQAMVGEGYVDEVRGIIEAGWSPSEKPLRSFAYRHMVEHCHGDLLLDEAIRRTARDTRHYAKKQRTWARNLKWTPSGPSDIDMAVKKAFNRE
jgi:tRNA dimethylallyltransferase